MRSLAAVLSPVLALLLPALPIAAEDRPLVRPAVSRATHFTISCPVRDLEPATRRTVEASGPVHSIDRPRLPEAPDSSGSHVDGALQDALTAPAGGLPPVLVNFPGMSNLDNLTEFGFEVIPSSANAAVGPDHIVQGANFPFRVYDKFGNPLTDPFAMSDLFQGAGGNCEQYDRGDPIVLYDWMADRWLLAQFAYAGVTTGPYSLCVAVSQSGDPTGSYFAYDFSTGNEFPNLPHWGVWPDGYYGSYTQFTNGATFNGTGAIAADRLGMLAGDPNAEYQIFDIGAIQPTVSGCLPSSHEGYATPPPGTPNLIWCPLFGGPGMGAFEVDADFVDPTRSYAVEHPDSPILLALLDRENPAGLDDIEQAPPATADAYLDSGQSYLKHAVRNRILPGGVQSYVMNLTVNVSGVAPTTPATHQAGIRWMELRRNAGTGGITVHQEGTYALGPGNGNGTNLWNGSMTIDADGNMWLGYGRSSASEFPSFDYTARRAGDPPGTLLGPGTIQAGGGSQQTASSRWGDYSSIAVDPEDDCTVWVTNTYYPTSSNATWHTRIASTKFDECLTGPTGALAGRVSDLDDSPLPGVLVRMSDGRATTTNASGSYTMPLLPPGTYTVIFELEGFLSVSKQVTIVAGQTTFLDQTLGYDDFEREITATGTFLEESCAPPNGAADPGETVTMDLCVTNNTGAPTADLTGVLYPTGGVVSTPGPKYYGVIGTDLTSCQVFTFSVDPDLAAGEPLFLNLQLTGGATNGFVTIPLTAGVPNVELTEDFEGTTPPALPAGFTASNGLGDPVLWQTTAGGPLGSNSLFVDNPAVASDKFLEFPPVTVNSGTLFVSFNHTFNLENTFDGGVLEISVDGGPFEDVLDIGGTFVTGGYNSIISSDFNSPLAGRPAWSGDLFEAIAGTSMSAPHAAGSAAILRLRMASDLQGSGNAPSAPTGTPPGWWVDDIRIWDGGTVCAPVGTGLDVDAHAIAGSSSNLNQVLEPGEDVQIGSFQVNGTPNPLPLTGAASNFVGPAGATYTIEDSTADYGSIPGNAVSAPAGTGDCFTATADCYVLGVSNPAPRPAAHWDATFDETLSSGGPKTWTLHVGSSFADVPTGNLFYRFIETIFHNAITGGCGSGIYCPGNETLRKQMAVFVLKAVEGAAYLPPAATGVFNDVPPADPFAPWIEELFRRGVVAGCATPGGPNYCPDNPVLRQQMAVFLLRTKLGSGYVPPACAGLFGDVPCPSLFADWIEDLYNRAITGGCQASPLLYCAGNPVTRGQMAVFLTKAFGLLLYGP